MRNSATGHALGLESSKLTPTEIKTAMKTYLDHKIEKDPKLEDHFYDDYEFGEYYQIY